MRTDVKKPTGSSNFTAGGTDTPIVSSTPSTSKKLLALHTAIQNAALRFWFATPSRWGRGTIRTGARHTTKQAGNLPDSEVFSRSEFMVSGLGVSIRKDGSTTCFVCLHPAPPDGLDSHCVGFQFNKERETMTASPVASRSAAPTAHALNFEAVNTTTSEAQAFALLQATSDAAMAKLYLSRGNIPAARRKAVQLLKALQVMEVAA